MNDLNAALFCSLEINRGIPGPRRDDHAEPGQPLDDGTRHRRAFPHHADDVEWLQALDDGVGVCEMVVKYGDGRPRIQHRPVRERKSDTLVVVQDSYSEALLVGVHRVPPVRCDPLAARPTGRHPSGIPWAMIALKDDACLIIMNFLLAAVPSNRKVGRCTSMSVLLCLTRRVRWKAREVRFPRHGTRIGCVLRARYKPCASGLLAPLSLLPASRPRNHAGKPPR